MEIPPPLFQKTKCPICGLDLTIENRSQEHIFPQWLLKYYDLYNLNLKLLNGSVIPYRLIKIPLCKKCNGERFSKLENNIKNIFERGKIKKIEQYEVVIWLIKIYLGIRNMEQRLPFDRAKKDLGNILPDNFFEDQSQLMFGLLQNYNPKTKFVGHLPWSFFTYKITNKETQKFWFADNLNFTFISIQLGQLGVVCLITDGGGQQQSMSESYNKLKNMTLSGSQFKELAVRHLYTESIRDYIPRFSLIVGSEGKATFINLTSTITYKPFNSTDYHKCLANYLGLDLSNVKIEKNDFVTFF